MRVLVCGGRDYNNREQMTDVLRENLMEHDVVVHGAAPGADALAGDIAGRVLGIEVDPHPAQWKRYGKAAGPIRNQEMLDSGVDRAIAFPGGSGTADMTDRLVKADVPIVIVEEES